MSIYENEIVILLRKICALALPDSFDASEDTSRGILIDKIKEQNESLSTSISNFLIAFESRNFILSDYQLKLKAPDVWKPQVEMFEKILLTRTEELIKDCKALHISIEHELSQLLD